MGNNLCAGLREEVVSAHVIGMPMCVHQERNTAALRDLRHSSGGEIRQPAIDDDHTVVPAEHGDVSTCAGN
jgi:hypothetical protein